MALACRECGRLMSVPRGQTWQWYRCRLCGGRLRPLCAEERAEWASARADGIFPPCYEAVPWLCAREIEACGPAAGLSSPPAEKG